MEVFDDLEIIFAKERLLWDDTYNKGVKACFCHFHVSTMEPPNFHSSSNIRSHLDNMNLPCSQFHGQSSVMIQPWVMTISCFETCQSKTRLICPYMLDQPGCQNGTFRCAFGPLALSPSSRLGAVVELLQDLLPTGEWLALELCLLLPMQCTLVEILQLLGITTI